MFWGKLSVLTYVIFVQVMEEKHAEKAELEAAIAAIRFKPEDFMKPG